MNKKGFSLIELLSTIVIIGLVMLAVVPLLNQSKKENDEVLYHSYEDMIEEYAKFNGIKEDDLDYIALGDILELDTIKNDCEGYALKENVNYKAYISCGDKYQTDGFDENLIK